ncbi:MAG: polyprenyl synthetase family protein [Bacteroidetes bacterium]|jgi:geranylgeranyl diphosphate synthase type II|nr:polyprenyl synthetase family protein [Bacteroidota bacterium]MBT4337028.1 polyprenyl synthetase family protein [Bacteroidota bacterium]MBT4968225.1 polyprenyl synthetase family protein [Bacteroidota bacterium]MBT6836565.1 polyprenyl synthetase family protein [Bacteroidota bacterium]MBT7040716.1 polyprenyl synthetase family protein [Bacteroidota bacterium]
MQSFNELLELVSNKIEKLKYQKEPRELYEPIEYILALGGKRIRPVICLMSCEMFGGKIDKAIYAAIGMEMFHNFTLVHDDIMDDADMRRGKPTVHVNWNDNRALLSGDAMIILANQLMMRVDDHLLRDVMALYNKTGLQVCDGQQLDLNFEKRDSIRMDEYMKMIELKTAVLLAGCLRLGAVIAETSDVNKDLIEEFGWNLGISFQIEDDLLDSFGDFEKFGKSIGGDILINKKTFLLVKAMEIADKDTRLKIDHWLNLKEFDKSEKVKTFISIYNKLNIKEIALAESKVYYDKAIDALNRIDILQEEKIQMVQFAKMLISREN